MQTKLVRFLLKTAWVLELVIALFILLVTVVQMVLTGSDSVHYLLLGQFDLNQFFANTMNVVVGVEFVKMLVLHTPRAVTDVLLFAGHPAGGGRGGPHLPDQKVFAYPGGLHSIHPYPESDAGPQPGQGGGS